MPPARVSRLINQREAQTNLWPTREALANMLARSTSTPRLPPVPGCAHQETENRARYFGDNTLGGDACRIRCKPGSMARFHSAALNIQRVKGVKKVR